MSQEAAEYMSRLAEAYRQNRFPNYKVWMFDRGHEEPFHVELMNLHGFIKLKGTRGASYVLTDAGFRRIKDFLADGN
jgi:hypothetical protein